ncbi:hypothetical protein C8J57DRAFT_1229592 [Mycena rebaudengoi]|nr:hypothetical protein C8J57DRAFT_1229592 [Mycena rebaudengoi]
MREQDPNTRRRTENTLTDCPICVLNASKFLNHEWVNISLLHEYIGQPQNSALPDASTTRLSTISGPVRVKIEVPLSSVVEAEPRTIRSPQASADIKIRTLHESGREVFELLSDSEPDADDSDSDLEWLEVERAVDYWFKQLCTCHEYSSVTVPSRCSFLQRGGDAAIKPGWQVPDTSFWNVPGFCTNLALPWKNVPRLRECALHAVGCAVHGMYLPSDFCWSR